MFFNSLLFSHQIIRLKPLGLNHVVVYIPRNFWWKPVYVTCTIYDENGKFIKTETLSIAKNNTRLLFNEVFNGDHLVVWFQYKGWFSTKYKMIEIHLPPNIKPATNLSVKISKVYWPFCE